MPLTIVDHRAQKRMDNEDVYGKRIFVHFPNQSPPRDRPSPVHRKSQSPVLHSRSYPNNGNYNKPASPLSPLVNGRAFTHRRPSPCSPRSYYMYQRSHSIATVTHSRSPDYEWTRYQETKRPRNYYRTQSLSPKNSPEKTSKPRPIRAKQLSPVSSKQYGTKGSEDGIKSPMGRPHSHIPGLPNTSRRKVSIDDEANYTVHLVQSLGEDDVYVTRGDSLEGLDSIGASGSSYRHLPEGAEVLRGSSRGIASPRSDEKVECGGDNQLFGNLKLEDSNYAPGGSLPWRIRSSPGPQRTDPSQKRVSPNFRRTPGASRPNSRNSYSSGGSMSSSTRSSPFMGFGSNENNGNYFQPIRNQSPLLSAADLVASKDDVLSDDLEGEDEEYSEAQLMVTNLDYNISAREWKKILFTEFQQQVKVIGVHIQTQPDNTNVGYVKMHTVEDARYAISVFHRKKIGYKRIHVSLLNNDNDGSPPNVRSEVIALMKEISGYSLPLFKFIEMFEKRYHRTISVSELYRMRDTVEIEELGSTGRTVSLLPGASSSPLKDSLDDREDEILESPVCKIHCKDGGTHYMEAFDATAIPTVRLQVKSFAAKVHTLLQIHDGSMPLVSFIACYSAEIAKLETVSSGGVPLEHLISCVPGVKVAVCKTGIKKVQWAENKPPTSIEFGKLCNSPLLSQHLSQFTRDVVELLKHSPQCRMPFSKFIPNYHHHFGRQCRVADYGYTKLMELFDAIPHVVQIIGGGSRKYVTLSHRAQVKRFTTDVLRILKSQASKQISILDFPVIYNKLIGKPFQITDYGICFIEDLFNEIPESTITVTGAGKDMVLSISKRDQTPEEVERTKQFAVEVIDLLKHSPQCRMPFNKFIPAYHHHFGKQCKVADYGFTKLIELFEAIPHVLQILEEDDEKILCLTEYELLKVLEEQVTTLLKACTNQKLPVPEFLTAFLRCHGHSIRLSDYGANSVVELIHKIPNAAQIENQDGRLVIGLVDHSYTQQIAERVLLILMDQVDGSMKIGALCSQYSSIYGEELNVEEIVSHLPEYVQVSSEDEKGTAKLTPLQVFARDTRTLLQVHQGKLALQHFEAAYAQHYGVNLVPASYGHPSVVALLQSIPHLVTIRGRGQRRTLLLCHSFQRPMPSALMVPIINPADQVTMIDFSEPKSNSPSTDSGIIAEEEEKEVGTVGMIRGKSPFDLLADSIPSAVPSPDLQPMFLEYNPNLMNFDPSPLTIQEILSGMTEEEKAIQQTPLCQTPVSDMLQFAAQLLPPMDHPEKRPASADSFFHPPMYQGYRDYTSAQLDDPAVLTDSTQFYANYNANYQPVCLENRLWYPNVYAAGQCAGTVATNSMQNLVGAADWIPHVGHESGRATVAERFLNSGMQSSGLAAQAANDLNAHLQEQPPSPSLEMAKAMLKELQVPASKAPAVYAGEKESQSQAAEVIPTGGRNVQSEPNALPTSPSFVKSESATEALMRALRACSPNAKVSAAANIQPSRKGESTNQEGGHADKASGTSGQTEDPQDEILLKASEASAMVISSPRKSLNGAEVRSIGSPKRSLSDSSSPSESPVKQGTPRKVRIAARFDVPIEGASDESN